MNKSKVIAFYLPQFHPTAENDQWWGKGFTEWTNVVKAKPLFKGHQQPNIPSELGFYDLRLSESREQQALLAKEHGVDAFCYCHYWMGNGKQLLEKPLQQVVSTGKPHFPFCLGWANHHWEKKFWNKDVSIFNKERLMTQEYPGIQDHKAHFYTMINTFKDARYYKVNGKLLFIIYDINNFPLIEEFMSLWQELARENGLPGFYFMSMASDKATIDYSNKIGIDGVIYENLHSTIADIGINRHRFQNLVATILRQPLSIMSYKKFISKIDYSLVMNNKKIYPSIYPNWDTSPRRGVAGDIIIDSTPELFYTHVSRVVKMMESRDPEDNIIFLKSWNEWAEGNYMEPDLKYGRGRLEALKSALGK